MNASKLIMAACALFCLVLAADAVAGRGGGPQGGAGAQRSTQHQPKSPTSRASQPQTREMQRNERQAQDGMGPEERERYREMTQAERQRYDGMGPEERARYREMTRDERQLYDGMGPQEQARYRQMNREDGERYLRMNAEERQRFAGQRGGKGSADGTPRRDR